MRERQFQTAKGRLDVVRRASEDFCKHVETVPGAVVGPELRVAVAKCARDALFCKACAESQAVCFPKQISFFTTCSEMKHDKPIVGPDAKVTKVLTDLVHAIVNHQACLDKAWYDDTVEAVKGSGLVDASSSRKNSNVSSDVLGTVCAAAVAEVTALTAASHGIHAVYLALGEEPPKLPTKTSYKESSNVDFGDLIYRVRRDDTISAAPYILWPDVNTGSKELSKLLPKTREVLPKWLNDKGPTVGLSLALDDFVMYEEILGKWYIPTGMIVAMVWLPRDPYTYCPSIPRHEVEALASGIASNHNCNY